MTRHQRRPGRKSRGRSYTPAEKAAAVELVREHGIAETVRRTGYPKQTLQRWAKTAGIDSAPRVLSQVAAAAEAVRLRAVDAKVDAVALLEEQLTGAARAVGDIVEANRLAVHMIVALPPDQIRIEVGMAGPYPVIEDDDVRAAVARVLALRESTLPFRDLVGAQTRAVHDLALLNGEATERVGLVAEINPALVPPAMDEAPVLELAAGRAAS